MRMKFSLARKFLLSVFLFAFLTAASFLQPQQGLAATSQDGGAAKQRQAGTGRAARSSALLILRTQVTRAGEKTIVQVDANGPLTYQTLRLSDPERLVLDFPGAHLATPASADSSAALPVRGVRTGQFKPGVARVVIDLAQPVSYRVRSLASGVTVEFGGVTPEAAVRTAPAAQRKETKRQSLMQNRESAASSPPSVAGPVRTRVADSSGKPAAALANLPPTEIGVAPLEASVADGMLTLHAHDQTLRMLLTQIGSQAGIIIRMGDAQGNERFSVDFQHYRIDEALRQILKGYDALFFYAGGTENSGTLALRTVWVYPAGRQEALLPASAENTMTAVERLEPLHSDQDSAYRARAIESVIRRKGRGSVAEVLEALRDPSDQVRLRALFQSLISGVAIPRETLIDLVLKDESAKVRCLALQALPLDAELRWVAERAASDANQSVSELANEILRELDLANRASSWASHAQQPPER